MLSWRSYFSMGRQANVVCQLQIRKEEEIIASRGRAVEGSRHGHILLGSLANGVTLDSSLKWVNEL